MSEFSRYRGEPKPRFSDPHEAVDFLAKDLANDKEQIKLTEFAGFYPAETIAADQHQVNLLKQRIAAEDGPDNHARRLARVFEKVFTDQVELSNWLGENVSTVGASEYDDLFGGIDTIAQIDSETASSHLGLTFDVTVSTQKIAKKLERIKQEINAGKLSTIKYFISPDETFKGQLEKVPRVVIGVSGQTSGELALLSANRESAKLRDHFVQIQILEELIIQLEAFSAYATSVGQTKLVPRFEQPLAIFKQVLRSPEMAQKISAYSRTHARDSFRDTDSTYKTLTQEIAKIFATT